MKSKAVISVILSVTFVSSTFTMTVMAKTVPNNTLALSASVASSDDGFIIEDGVLVNYTGKGGDITIPSSVTSIGNSAFFGNEDITSVIIPSSVTSIEDEAFNYCIKLSAVTIPVTVTSIGNGAFDGTPWLKNFPNDFVVVGNSILLAYKGNAATVIVPDTVKSIGAGAFSQNATLDKVTVSIGVTAICDNAFSDCENLESVTLPVGLSSIGDSAFSGCSALSTINIPSSVTSIGYEAFAYTGWLESSEDLFVVVGDNILIAYTGVAAIVTIPGTVKSISGGAFENYYGDALKTIIVPSSVINICDSAFSGCKDLSNINIPDSVKSIGNSAFSGCESLAGISLPSSVSFIGAEAFFDCSTMTQITVDNNNENFSSQDGVLFNKTKTNLLQFPCGTLGKYAIPSTVKEVADSAFSGCSGLTDITIPEGITGIGSEAFSGCEALSSVTVPGSVTDLGFGAFEHCSMLGTVTIQSGVTIISEGMFSGCGSLESVSIPGTVASIGSNAFSECSKLESIALPAGLTSIEYGTFSDCVKLASITFPDVLKTISDSAFSGCKMLAGITFPIGLLSIGKEAFAACSALTNISIPASVTSIGASAFMYCTGITQINVDNNNLNYSSQSGVLFNLDKSTLLQYPCGNQGSYIIPDTVKDIGDSAFLGCEDLTGITIPVGVTKIEDNAFCFCYGLTSVLIPDTVKSIGDYAFYGYNESGKPSGLANIIIPNSVTSIGSLAFEGTAWLENNTNDFVVVGNGFLVKYKGTATDVTIPSNVITICGSAFGQNATVVNVFIPGSVTEIGEGAFSFCSSLENVIISMGVKTIDQAAFEMCFSLTSVSIPNSVTSIANDSFFYCDSIKIFCVAGSYAENYVKDNKIPYTIVIPVTAIKLSVTNLTWIPGKSQTLTTTITPANATNKGVIWSTSNKNVASVNSSGNVKAVSYGTAIIYCIAKDGNGAIATCTVNVLPATPTAVKATSASYNSIKVNWAPVSGATGYVVYRLNSITKKYEAIKTTSATSYTDTSLTINKLYYYEVKAYKTVNSVNVFSDYSAAASCKALPSVPSSFAVKRASSTSLKLSWAGVSGATGYEVYRYSPMTEKYVLVKTTSSLSYTNTGLKTNTTYSFKIRAYKTVGGVKIFGAYTASKSAKPY